MITNIYVSKRPAIRRVTWQSHKMNHEEGGYNTRNYIFGPSSCVFSLTLAVLYRRNVKQDAGIQTVRLVEHKTHISVTLPHGTCMSHL